MASNKDAYIRYRAINRCLIDKKFATLEELIAYCEDVTGIAPISKRTIQKDLEDMREDTGLGFFAPIIYDRLNRGYHYTEKGYSIDQIPLKKEEVQALNNALGLLLEYKGTGIFGQIEEAIDKLVNKVKMGMMQQQHRLGAFMELERGYTDSGASFLKVCVEAIRDQTVLKIKYCKFNSSEFKEHFVHPCYLKEYRNRWYLIGWHQKHHTFSIFSLDRIIDAIPDFQITYEPPPFDPANHFKYVIGMSAPDVEPVKIVFEVNRQQVPYLLSQPVHPSLSLITENGELCQMSLEVIVNFELKHFILGLGADIKVLAPQNLADEIKEILESSLSHY